MATVYLYQDANIVVTSTIVSGRLQLSINGVILGTVDDCWDPSLMPPPPAVTRMTILNAPDGTLVSARWQPWSGGTWTPFNSGVSGAWYDFPTPPGGTEKEIRFDATAATGEVCDPKLVLRTKLTED